MEYEGSFPVNGGYCWWEYPNWAAKFLIDACLLEDSREFRSKSEQLPDSSRAGSCALSSGSL